MLEYAPPQIQSAACNRCTSDGFQDDVNGTYARIIAAWTFSPLNGLNHITSSVVQVNSGTYNIGSNSPTIVGGGHLATDASYDITVQVTDTVGSVSVFRISLPSAAYLIHIRRGGKSIGFGTAASDEDNTATFGWKAKMKQPLGVSEGGTGVSSIEAFVSALGLPNVQWGSKQMNAIAVQDLGTATVTFGNAFSGVPVVVGSVRKGTQDGTDVFYVPIFTVLSATKTGFTAQVINGGDAAIHPVIDWIAIGA